MVENDNRIIDSIFISIYNKVIVLVDSNTTKVIKLRVTKN